MNTPNSRIAAFAGIAIAVVAVAAYTLRDEGNATDSHRSPDSKNIAPNAATSVAQSNPSADRTVPKLGDGSAKERLITTKMKESTELLARTHDDHIN